MGREGINSFEEFWPYYVRNHSHPGTRFLHLIGLFLGLVIGTVSLWLQLWAGFLAVPLAVYLLGWVGHTFVEGNHPTTVHHPVYSVRGFFRMIRLMISGTMGTEASRILRPMPSVSPVSRSEIG